MSAFAEQKKAVYHLKREMSLHTSIAENFSGSSKIDINILIVEQNADDIKAIRGVLEDLGVTGTIREYYSAQEAVRYLDRQNPYAKVEVPDFVILDLEGKGAKSVLDFIKRTPWLNRLKVIILTGEQDRSFRGDNCYLTKPLNLEAVRSAIVALSPFWFVP